MSIHIAHHVIFNYRRLYWYTR